MSDANYCFHLKHQSVDAQSRLNMKSKRSSRWVMTAIFSTKLQNVLPPLFAQKDQHWRPKKSKKALVVRFIKYTSLPAAVLDVERRRYKQWHNLQRRNPAIGSLALLGCLLQKFCTVRTLYRHGVSQLYFCLLEVSHLSVLAILRTRLFCVPGIWMSALLSFSKICTKSSAVPFSVQNISWPCMAIVLNAEKRDCGPCTQNRTNGRKRR